MNIHVLYFAQLREKFGLSEERVLVPDSVRTVRDLIAQLCARGGVWTETFDGSQAFRVAMNQEMIELDTQLVEGAELAIFRPVTGG
ncbi:molybdopterin converting factor subunit 1 [Zwartia panacis]|uniref:molybdopterin converting factor subunit 1 n=1 Tax=Zwartia panacis TaxID=2683345 RepID=UPI0025B4A31A|nr:molybdopterin converting factor subunit 1 [Zwartia panacis]MDN4016707.1 molybdopterin converting factor subunit 1 [Zwartia panacis]